MVTRLIDWKCQFPPMRAELCWAGVTGMLSGGREMQGKECGACCWRFAFLCSWETLQVCFSFHLMASVNTQSITNYWALHSALSQGWAHTSGKIHLTLCTVHLSRGLAKRKKNTFLCCSSENPAVLCPTKEARMGPFWENIYFRSWIDDINVDLWYPFAFLPLGWCQLENKRFKLISL